MASKDAMMSIEIAAEHPVSKRTPGLFKGTLMRLVRKFKKDKSEVDKQYDDSIRALEVWKNECEAKLAQKEEALRRRYDSIDITPYGDAQAAQMELKKKQQFADDQAFDAEIERELGSSV